MDYADRLSWKVILENIMETLTIYLWPVLFSTHYQRVKKRKRKKEKRKKKSVPLLISIIGH